MVYEDRSEIKIGQLFENRAALSKAGIHKVIQQGIAGNKKEGAYSIVLSGGYEDDEDHGDVIVYTGEGGRDQSTGKQIRDQVPERGNAALIVSFEKQIPISVTRGHKHRSLHSPKQGYRYAGKFIITKYWTERGRSGFKVYRFRLERVERN